MLDQANAVEYSFGTADSVPVHSLLGIPQILLCTAASMTNVVLFYTLSDAPCPRLAKTLLFLANIGFFLLAITHGIVVCLEWSDGTRPAKNGKALNYLIVHEFAFSLENLSLCMLATERLATILASRWAPNRDGTMRTARWPPLCFVALIAAIIIYSCWYTWEIRMIRNWWTPTCITNAISFLTFPICVIGYRISAAYYERTIATSPLNARYQISETIRLTHCIIPVALVGVLFSSIFFISFYLNLSHTLGPSISTPMYRNGCSLQALLTPWLLMLRHRFLYSRLHKIAPCLPPPLPSSGSTTNAKARANSLVAAVGDPEQAQAVTRCYFDLLQRAWQVPDKAAV